MKKYLNYKILIALSFVFLAVYLFKTDKLEIPAIHSFSSLGASFLLLFSAFLIQSVTWYKILKQHYEIDFRTALISDGLSVFMKYIPGKVFSILGRSNIVCNKYNYPIRDVARLSLESQVLIIWVGLIVGSVALLGMGNNSWFLYIVIGIIILGIFLLTSLFQNAAKKILSLFLKREIELPHLGIKKTIQLLPIYILYWLILGFGFYFFQKAFIPGEISVYAIFSFPLATTTGIVAIIVPGGIGIREGILTAIIHSAGADLAFAASIAILSRFWFLAGELFFFTLSLLLFKNSNIKARK